MSFRKFLGCVVSVLTLSVTAVQTAAAQETPTPANAPASTAAVTTTQSTTASQIDGGPPRYIRPETPEQRRQRLGTQEDPGADPDPETIWVRFGKKYRIVKFEKRWAKYTDTPGLVKPFAPVNFVEELYQENDNWVWVWLEEFDEEPPPTPEEIAASHFRKIEPEQIKFLESMRGEFSPMAVPKSNVSVSFKRSSAGLPQDGSWRNSLAVADMNGDGKMDIILPPERAGRVIPSIFIGDGKGGWQFWETKWANRLNYGSVVAADFNKDKIMDLAFGVHLSGVVILLHDGKGNFREVERVSNFPTRRIIARDVDNDGWTDVVALSEGPVMRGKEMMGADYANLRAWMNRKKGESWEGMNISAVKERVSGDWLTAGDLNGDRYPDFAGSNLYRNGVHTIYVSQGANKYNALPGGNDLIPFLSYYWAATAGRFSSKDRDDAIVTYTRQWVGRLNPADVPPPVLQRVAGLDRITYVDGTPKRVPIMRWGGERVSKIVGLNHGDFDGDGKLDIAFTRSDARELVLLMGDGRGGFRQATVEGVELGSQRHYDLTVADVNADKRPDVILMYEAESGSSFSRKNGKVDVFLNQGATKGE